MSMSDPLNHLGSIWYYTKPLNVTYSPTQWSFLQQTGSRSWFFHFGHGFSGEVNSDLSFIKLEILHWNNGCDTFGPKHIWSLDIWPPQWVLRGTGFRDPKIQGPNLLGTIWPEGSILWGSFVQGDRKSGTGSRALEVRARKSGDQMGSLLNE